MPDEELSCAPAPDEQLNEALGQVEGSVAALSAQVSGLAGQLEQFRALLRSRLEDLVRRETECRQLAASLSEREQGLAAGSAKLAAQVSELQKREEALQRELDALAEAGARISKQEEDLAAREAALRDFQAAFTSITQMFADAPPASAAAAELLTEETSSDSYTKQTPGAPMPVAEDLPTAGPIDAAPDQSPVTASEPESVEVPTPESTIEASEPSADEISAATSSTDTTEPKPPAAARIDEAKLDPEVRKKLRIMRRLTGGTVPDEELLSRIYSDARTAGTGQTRPAKPKRRWWLG